MNSIQHHLSDASISEYASGTLPESIEVVVACHLTLCPHCRQRSQAADRIGGYFLDSANAQIDGARPKLSALDMLQNIRQSVHDDASQKPHAGDPDHPVASMPAAYDIPMPLARRLPADLDNLNWKMLAKGVQQYDLSTSIRDHGQHGNKTSKLGRGKTGAFKLLKMQPGTRLIEHSHGDHELTLVLKGSYSDDLGRFGVGDVADLGPEDTHKPHIDSAESCIALIATNSPTQYRGILGRLLQPFVGI